MADWEIVFCSVLIAWVGPLIMRMIWGFAVLAWHANEYFSNRR